MSASPTATWDQEHPRQGRGQTGAKACMPPGNLGGGNFYVQAPTVQPQDPHLHHCLIVIPCCHMQRRCCKLRFLPFRRGFTDLPNVHFRPFFHQQFHNVVPTIERSYVDGLHTFAVAVTCLSPGFNVSVSQLILYLLETSICIWAKFVQTWFTVVLILTNCARSNTAIWCYMEQQKVQILSTWTKERKMISFSWQFFPKCDMILVLGLLAPSQWVGRPTSSRQ